jgi:hypothetical protein
MKKIIYLLMFFPCLIIGHNSSKPTVSSSNISLTVANDSLKTINKLVRITNDTIRIENDSLKYEVLIIDPGFNSWLVSRSFPRGYHTQAYLENKNFLYITEWNNRVLLPERYNSNLYEMNINYDFSKNYGYEVNYLIYNYMVYFQNTYKQKLFGNVPIR